MKTARQRLADYIHNLERIQDADIDPDFAEFKIDKAIAEAQQIDPERLRQFFLDRGWSIAMGLEGSSRPFKDLADFIRGRQS